MRPAMRNTELEFRLCGRHVWSDDEMSRVVTQGRSWWREAILDVEASLSSGTYNYQLGALHCCDQQAGEHWLRHQYLLDLDKAQVEQRFVLSQMSQA
jgi:hypothetical protein